MNFYPDPYLMEEAAVVLPLITSVLTSALPSTLLGIASYVLTSMALYTLASRRGIGKAWLSWVPILNVWIIGSLSDQYRYVVKGQIKSKRKSLLILNIVNLLIALVMLGICIFLLAELTRSTIYGAGEDAILATAMGSLFGILGLLLPMGGVAVAAAVIRYMALYDIYTSMDPANNVLFTVLSIIFNVTEPFFLFFNRNKDAGMPPRKQEPQQPGPEPWEGNKDYL